MELPLFTGKQSWQAWGNKSTLQWDLDLIDCSFEILIPAAQTCQHFALSPLCYRTAEQVLVLHRRDAVGGVLGKHTFPGAAVLDSSAADWAASALSAALSSSTAALEEVWFSSINSTDCLQLDEEKGL